MSDMLNGQYRKIYEGYLKSRKVNALSIEAECMFIRMIAAADDYGGVEVTDDIVGPDLFPRRPDIWNRCPELLNEIYDVGLIDIYRVGGEKIAQIFRFEELQPAGKNGRRIRRIKENPNKSRPIPNVDGESGNIQGNPKIPIPTIPYHTIPDHTKPLSVEGGDEFIKKCNETAQRLRTEWQAGSKGSLKAIQAILESVAQEYGEGSLDTACANVRGWSAHASTFTNGMALRTWLKNGDWESPAPKSGKNGKKAAGVADRAISKLKAARS